jgi:hypothetical protein
MQGKTLKEKKQKESERERERERERESASILLKRSDSESSFKISFKKSCINYLKLLSYSKCKKEKYPNK